MNTLGVLLLLLLIPFSSFCFDDTGWHLVYQETFDSSYSAVDGQMFGADNWLIYQLLNGGAITVANGYAQLSAPDFWNAGLIRSTQSLPSEYKVRTKIGYINYDLSNYEQADYDHPDFNTHGGNYENGMYFLTVTNDTCVGNECAENWWHYHRKMVIDVDNHLEGSTEVVHPVFMVFMGENITVVGNELRTWNGSAWDSSAWNWNVAHTYVSNTWYYAELEKIHDSITLRLYDGNENILEETDPVELGRVFDMSNPIEFLYVGEPHTDDYEGEVRIDDITLLVPAGICCAGERGNADGDDNDILDISDLLYLVDYMFAEPAGPPPPCLDEADVALNSVIDISDLLYLIICIIFV